MEDLLLDIVRHLREQPHFGARQLVQAIHRHSERLSGSKRFSKKDLMPYYLRIKQEEPERWQAWNIDENLEQRLIRLIQMKPRRSASGVATITVITKPWPCASNCRYCPSDVRMPKSYRHNEPACQRAERCWFDPFLQVSARLTALTQMGHPTQKVELIVLGGTWSDYPASYQLWFVHGLLLALNMDDSERAKEAARRRALYEQAGLARDADELARQSAALQEKVDCGELSYNAAVAEHYGRSHAWTKLADLQSCSKEELHAQQDLNEEAAHRCVGLVVETRPDAISAASLRLLRELGCTKIQMGVQSLDAAILAANERDLDIGTIERAFSLLRLFGFKIHAHFMVNLLGATPESDIEGYSRFATEAPYLPDEVKLYPCALIRGTALCRDYEQGGWQPYSEEELVGVLARAVLDSPPWLRISRMIRDFSSQDIEAGNKKTNLRQLVEASLDTHAPEIREIRYREIGTQASQVEGLELEVLPYESASTSERFLQWVDPAGRIAGFLRLSLPHQDAIAALGSEAPVGPGEAMIREVHVYGRAARLDETAPAQHRGLGKQLVAKAEDIARSEGYARMNVISALGTRAYYRRLGYTEQGLYLQKPLGT